MIKISFVIPAYNEEKNIGRLLRSLKKLPQENILEILVVNNNSTDGTGKVVREESTDTDGSNTKIRLIDEPKKGVAWARSRGAEETKGDVIAFIDADSYVDERWLSKLLHLFSDEKVVCVSGPSYYFDMHFCARTIAHIYWWFASVFVAKIVGYMGNFANMAVRADAFRKIGGIDTNIVFYGDDTDLSHRMSEVGKMVFSFGFYNFGSGRRFKEHGLIVQTWRYTTTYFAEVLFNKVSTKGYTEVR